MFSLFNHTTYGIRNKKELWKSKEKNPFRKKIISVPSIRVRWPFAPHRLGKFHWTHWARRWWWVACLRSWPSVRVDAHNDLWTPCVAFVDALLDWHSRDFAILSHRQTNHRIFSPDSLQNVARSRTGHHPRREFGNFDTKCGCPWMWMWWRDRRTVAISDDALVCRIFVWTIPSAVPNKGCYRNADRTTTTDAIHTNSCRSISIRPVCAHFPQGIWPTDPPAHSRTTRTNPVCGGLRTTPIYCSASCRKFHLPPAVTWPVPFSIRHDGVALVCANRASNADPDDWCRVRQTPTLAAC